MTTPRNRSVTEQGVSALGLSRRWIGALLGRGLLVGMVHPTLAMFLGVALGEQDTHFWFGFVVFGIAIAAVLSTAFAILTLPVVLHAARVGRWGWLRPAVTFASAAAVVAIAVVLVPLEPAGEQVTAANILLLVVWFWLGPACWGAAIMWRVTGRFQLGKGMRPGRPKGTFGRSFGT